MGIWNFIRSIFMNETPFIPISGRITCYGYPEDSTPDSNSAAGIGAWDNDLTDGVSMAISRDVEAAFERNGIKPKDRVELRLSDGSTLNVTWDDRTAAWYGGKKLTGRFDLYCQRRPSELVDTPVTGFRKV